MPLSLSLDHILILNFLLKLSWRDYHELSPISSNHLCITHDNIFKIKYLNLAKSLCKLENDVKLAFLGRNDVIFYIIFKNHPIFFGKSTSFFLKWNILKQMILSSHSLSQFVGILEIRFKFDECVLSQVRNSKVENFRDILRMMLVFLS